MNWDNAQVHEAAYWRDCYGMTAFGEVTKQEMYAREMRITEEYADAYGDFDLRGKSILDVGCGPWSMMLRCHNTGRLVGIDPLDWPPSVHRRYTNYGIEFHRLKGEDVDQVQGNFDEVWMYNVLQHVVDPALIVKKAARFAPVFRIFEWVHIPSDACHPHVLTPEGLHDWFKAAGMTPHQVAVRRLKEFWSNADALVGVFH